MPQVISVFDSVYELNMPLEYRSWLTWINLSSDLFFDGVCAGTVIERLLLIALLPFALVIVVGAIGPVLRACRQHFVGPHRPMSAFSVEVSKTRAGINPSDVDVDCEVTAPVPAPASTAAGIEPDAVTVNPQKGQRRLQVQRRRVAATALHIMAPLLVVSFYSVNSVSRTVLNAIGACDTFYKDADLMVPASFLQMDLRIECYTEAHNAIKAVAWALFGLWPVGFPLLCVGLLATCRDAIRVDNPPKEQSLASATRFLWREYKPDYFWWEPLDMVRKLTLSAFVLFIPAQYPVLRLLVGLLLSVRADADSHAHEHGTCS